MSRRTVIRLASAAYDALVAEARAALPNECCGVLGGREIRVEHVYPVRNVAPEARTRYEMAPGELWTARRQVRADGLEVLGFYHSHPRTAASPSTYDIERAYYPEAVYIIVGLESGPRVRAYRIASGRADEIAVTVDGAQDT
jgi:proteasome lid subunit RPN8/RPN11